MISESGNDVKQYNLTAGKSLPEWLDERKRRTLLKKDVELRRRLELLQDFDMPSVSNKIQISKDGQYILSIGTYKPRIKCYDVSQLGLKFERCFDSEAIAFSVLSDDYSKLAFLHCDRYIELHAQFGKYYRFRVPKFGRDLAYNPANCDLYVVGAGPEVHRLNLEQGRFLAPLTSQSLGLNACIVNDDHQLLMIGGSQGHVEAWDPRSRQKAADLDVAFSLLQTEQLGEETPQISSLAFRDGLNLAVGTSTGHVLLYDIRSSRPLLVKDHYYGIPIKKVLFHSTQDQVISLDGKSAKIWDRNSGKAYTSIESECELNDICTYPGSGLMFMANEQVKMQVHYVPSLGPAPRWCSFLDNITEEIEESATGTVYDDYKFVTREELGDLGLDHLIGSTLLRAYMHGFFMDARLYRKAHSVVQPYTLDKFMKDKISRKMAEERSRRVQPKSDQLLPKTNKELFLKLKDQESGESKAKKKVKQVASDLLADDRFGSLFTDSRFQVDKDDQAYKLLNPVLTKLDAKQVQDLEQKYGNAANSEEEMEEASEDDFEDSEEESSDDDTAWTEQVKEAHKQLRRENQEQRRREKDEKILQKVAKTMKFKELNADELHKDPSKKVSKKSLAQRLEEECDIKERKDGHQMVFKTKKSKRQMLKEQEEKQHRAERQELRRSASSLKKDRIKPKFWNGKRII